MYNEIFTKQVKLLLQCLPAIRSQNYFVLRSLRGLEMIISTSQPAMNLDE